MGSVPLKFTLPRNPMHRIQGTLLPVNGKTPPAATISFERRDASSWLLLGLWVRFGLSGVTPGNGEELGFRRVSFTARARRMAHAE